MKTFNYVLVLLCVAVTIIGCAHCSRTLTHFQGKTTGVNPYGSGNIEVNRDSYWGDKECIMKLVNGAYNAAF